MIYPCLNFLYKYQSRFSIIQRPLDLGFAGSLEAGLEDHLDAANQCGV